MKKSRVKPVIILNGFLGSGKTTLFRNLLAQSKKMGIPISAIVNDMSELDVDGELLGSTGAVEENSQILVSISNCVLSSKKGIRKLDEAIKKLLANQNPKLIVIETSGSCHPLPLIEYFKNQNKVKLSAVFALVDSLMLNQDFDDGKALISRMQNNMAAGKRDTINLLVEQMMFSSHVFLTKTDRIIESKISSITKAINNINPYTAVQSVHFGKVDIKSLFHLQEYNYFNVAQLIDELKPILDSDTLNERPYDLATRVIKDDRPFHPERLWSVCHQYLDQKIYRSKGFFWLASRDKYSILWNQAAGGISLEIVGLWRTGFLEDENAVMSAEEISMLKDIIEKEKGRFGDRKCDITVIGDKSHVDRFTEALKSCFLSDKEIDLWNAGHTFEDPWPKNMVQLSD